MAARRAAFRSTERATLALSLRVVPYGEADAIVTLFTRDFGRMSAVARRARAPSKRGALAIEPMHTLAVRLGEREGQELVSLRASTIETPRLALTSDLERLERAGRALRWVRHVVPPRVPEEELWRSLIELLDAWNRPDDAPLDGRLAAFGLHALAILGWGLEVDRCVRCGRECPPGKAARLNPAAGGIVCSEHGGAPHLVSGELRAKLAAASNGVAPTFDGDEATRVLRFLDEAFDAHAG